MTCRTFSKVCIFSIMQMLMIVQCLRWREIPRTCVHEYEHEYKQIGFRHWLQSKFKLGIPVFFGRFGLPFGLIPKRVPIGLEVLCVLCMLCICTASCMSMCVFCSVVVWV